MKAVVQERYGAPDTLRLEDADEPVAGEGQVVVRVRAAALNPYDWHMLRGSPVIARPGMGWRRPLHRIAGLDAAGVVERIGPGVSEFAPGDEVLGFVPGAFAEYGVTSVSKLAPKPPGLTFTEAAALPVAGTTALRGIRDVAKVRAGQRVLIHGASGGVGHFAVQIAAAFGAEVTAVCGAANAELVRDLGAVRAIDYRTTDFAQEPDRYDVVLDNAGTTGLRDFLRVLNPDGTLVMNNGGGPGGFLGPLNGMTRGLLLNRFVGPSLRLLPTRQGRPDLVDLNRLVQDGRVRPVVSRTWTLPEAGRALAELEQGHTRGKAVIEIA